MCFSATASFTSSIVIGSAGIACLYTAKKLELKFFASIPLIFAVQQFTEGFVWLASTHSNYLGLHQFFMYAYLVFAQVLWPLWVPLSILMLEKGSKQRIFLYILLGIGIAEAVFMASGLIYCNVSSEIIGTHIKYDIAFLKVLLWPSSILYGMATVLPPFISSIRWMRWLGLALGVFYLISAIFYSYYITSVWCYFAALLSVFIFFIIKNIEEEGEKMELALLINNSK